MNETLKAKFERLECELSPENLTCDGELSRGQVAKRLADINKRWAALEREAGRKVSRDEVTEWMVAKWRAAR